MRWVATTGTPLPDLTIRQLEYLVAVDEHATWAAAASSVGVSPSALSQGLAELERRVGISLFEPVGRARVLRPAARPVLDHARRVLALTSDLVDWADRRRTGASGRVRLGLIDIAAVVHFPDVLRHFLVQRPEVELTLSVAPSGVLLDDIVTGRLDLAVCVAPPAPIAGVETTPILTEPLVVLAPPAVESVGPPASWGPWVLFPTGSHTRRAVESALVELGAPVEVAAESHQPDVLREMVVLGLGWTVLPRAQGVPLAEEVTEGPVLVERQLVLVRRAGSVADPVVDELAAILAG